MPLIGKIQTIFVTGDMGFVGKHFKRRLLESTWNNHIICADVVQGEDIRDCWLPDADRVYHLAAITDAQSADADSIYSVNVVGSLRLFERYKEKLVFASSSMANYPRSSPYADSKAVAEIAALKYGCAVVRFCNLFGPGGHSAVDKFRDGSEIVIRGTGEQVRTYTHVGHAVRAMVQARPGELKILEGQDWTVNQVAAMYPGKSVRREPMGPLDLMDGRQVV